MSLEYPLSVCLICLPTSSQPSFIHLSSFPSYSGQIVMTEGIKKWSYVTQDDVHFSTLTVHETLYYASLLRLEEGVYTRDTRAKRVEEMISMLGLEEARNTIVGDGMFHKGISGGQTRRLTIGVEIMNLPDCLFLDEPTTGKTHVVLAPPPPPFFFNRPTDPPTHPPINRPGFRHRSGGHGSRPWALQQR